MFKGNAGHGQSLRDILPADKVKELAWSGRPVSGEEAFAMGLVTALHDDPLAAAEGLVARLGMDCHFAH